MENTYEHIDKLNEEAWQIRRHDLDKAMSLVIEAQNLSIEKNYHFGMYSSLSVLGILAIYQNNFELSEKYLSEAMDYFRDNFNPLHFSRISNSLGFCHFIRGNLSEAISYLKSGLEVSKEYHIDEMSIFMLHNIGEIYKDASFYEEAIPYFLEATKINKDNNHPMTNPILSNLAICYQKIGNDELAYKYMIDIHKFSEASKDKMSSANYYELFSFLKYEQGEYDVAEKLGKRALELSQDIRDEYQIASSYLTLARIYYSTDRFYDSVNASLLALDVCSKSDVTSLISPVYKVLADSYYQLKDYENSAIYYKKYNVSYEKKISSTLNKRVSIMSSELKIESLKKDAEIYKLRNIKLKQKQDELALVSEIGRSIVNSLDFGELIDLIYSRINKFMDAPFLAVGILDENNILNYTSIIANNKRLATFNVPSDYKYSFGNDAIKKKETIYINNLSQPTGNRLNITPAETKDKDVLSLLFCPLLIKNKPIGVITIQSYRKDAYSTEIIQLLEGLTSYIAIAIRNANKTKLLSDTAKKLETTLTNLENTQTQLIQAEKLASLGQLVAGVAHELNTPLGSSITLISFLQKQNQKFEEEVMANNFSQADVMSFINRSMQVIDTVSGALTNASEMINSFKTVSIQQSELNLKSFNLNLYLENLLVLLSPILRKSKANVKINCDKTLTIRSYPNIITHIITQLITNSIFHGFRNDHKGDIDISVAVEDDTLHITYSDNGIGINEEIRPHIFEPFYGTNKIEGFMGLGLHSIHNMVTQILKGNIYLDDSVSETTFHIFFKKNI